MEQWSLGFIREWLCAAERELDKVAVCIEGSSYNEGQGITSEFRKLGLEHIRRLNSSCMFQRWLHSHPIYTQSLL